MPVPLFDTETPLAPLRETILERVSAVIDGGRFILGPEVKAFEQELGAYVGVGHAIGVRQRHDAITIAARALGVEPGDEVVVPSFTFYATAEAIAAMGATPVFCDIDRRHPQRHGRHDSPGADPKTKRSSPSTCSACRPRSSRSGTPSGCR